ncbi:hypothetical protein CERSUDRAFT_111510 [Gelatoporia subvermispora B]|uniref:Uncharacterized protein n=1 Tax=Ceriporiopsis subvermispora (strain B) TaxID=914234 RepID=M2QV28_CERS8|nr:hypothetical protein CERSUDRAFT_111510 [Gelatoporia subvermispora B]
MQKVRMCRKMSSILPNIVVQSMSINILHKDEAAVSRVAVRIYVGDRDNRASQFHDRNSFLYVMGLRQELQDVSIIQENDRGTGTFA